MTHLYNGSENERDGHRLLENPDSLSKSEAGELTETLPIYNDYPFILTRVVPSIYHAILLPADHAHAELVEIAAVQASMNKLPTFLVLGETGGLYFHPDGTSERSPSVPCGGTLLTGNLMPSIDFGGNRKLFDRTRRLRNYIKRVGKSGYITGDLRKGGRAATQAELEQLLGAQLNGVPNGLTLCNACGEWRGHCIDPNPVFENMLMQVHCLCQNDNRCAACGEHLAERKLNANLYDPSDGDIWHYPGFKGFGHKCSSPERS